MTKYKPLGVPPDVKGAVLGNAEVEHQTKGLTRDDLGFLIRTKIEQGDFDAARKLWKEFDMEFLNSVHRRAQPKVLPIPEGILKRINEEKAVMQLLEEESKNPFSAFTIIIREH